MNKKPLEVNIVRLLKRCKKNIKSEKSLDHLLRGQYLIYIQDVTLLLKSEEKNIDKKARLQYERDIKELELILQDKSKLILPDEEKKSKKDGKKRVRFAGEIEEDGEIFPLPEDEYSKAKLLEKSKSRNYHVQKLETTLRMISEQHERMELGGPSMDEEYEEDLIREEQLLEQNVEKRMEKETSDIKNISGRLKEKAKDIADVMDEDKEIVQEGMGELEQALDKVQAGRKKLKEHYDYMRRNCWSMCGLAMVFFIMFGVCVIVIRIFPKR